ncbi:hypothetical protein [Actibacterium sp. 188UL27-1]|uniref:hypothetical protein n=1 Tax=Actibacterium sp. 188UL27-1 TaxID=2786961 RepID=UPI00195CAA48|nr:hypothetical protein [Actibacterium sp. 188UL27-1]MBM7068174.1 hypothetical protein [Actibacterium sp. 188UL27-1]
MAQAPATPKFQRVVKSLIAAGLGPGQVAKWSTLAASETAALHRRAVPLARPRTPVLVCLIPLVGRHQIANWSAVQSRLSQTIASLRAQTNPNWRAVICGQDRPDLSFDDQVTFLPFTETVEGNDKWNKLAALAAHLPTLGLIHGYAMPFDADDLLACDTVAEMTNRRSTTGYLIEKGYVLDASTGDIAETAPQSITQPGQKAFWKLCGSCAAFRFDFSENQGDAAFIGAVTAHEHRMFPYLARLANRPLETLRKPAVLYIINHGQNFGARRGRTSFKTRYVQRFKTTDQKMQQGLAARFPAGSIAPG